MLRHRAKKSGECKLRLPDVLEAAGEGGAMDGVLGAGQEEVRRVRDHFADVAAGRDLPPHHALDRWSVR